MAQEDDRDVESLRNRVAELEARLGFPQKLELSRQATVSADARKKALELPDTQKSRDLAQQIATLADMQNVVVEWSAREVAGLSSAAALAAVRCCCCCCCCIGPTSW
jgi:hypothetical protein